MHINILFFNCSFWNIITVKSRPVYHHGQFEKLNSTTSVTSEDPVYNLIHALFVCLFPNRWTTTGIIGSWNSWTLSEMVLPGLLGSWCCPMWKNHHNLVIVMIDKYVECRQGYMWLVTISRKMWHCCIAGLPGIQRGCCQRTGDLLPWRCWAKISAGHLRWKKGSAWSRTSLHSESSPRTGQFPYFWPICIS